MASPKPDIALDYPSFAVSNFADVYNLSRCPARRRVKTALKRATEDDENGVGVAVRADGGTKTVAREVEVGTDAATGTKAVVCGRPLAVWGAC